VNHEAVPGIKLLGETGALQGTEPLAFPEEYVLDPATLGWGSTFSARFIDLPSPSLRPTYVPWRQVLHTKGAKTIAAWEDGATAITEHVFGKGKARLVSTLIGTLYNTSAPDGQAHLREFMKRLLGDVRPFVESRNPRVETALLKNRNGHFLVLVNHSEQDEDATVQVRLAMDTNVSVTDLLGGCKSRFDGEGSGRRLTTRIAAKGVQLYWLP
jgi:hypothetical protein